MRRTDIQGRSCDSPMRSVTAVLVVALATGCGEQPAGIPAPIRPSLTARIIIPANDSSFAEGQTILFSGVGRAGSIGLGGSSLVWTSDVDGQFGTGSELRWNALTPATHTITLTARDDAGATATASVQIEVMPTPPNRVFADRIDDASGSQVMILYVLPSDGPDGQLDLDGTLSNSVGSFQNWLAGQTGGRTLRMDTFAGELDVVFVRLMADDADVRSSDYGIDVFAPRLRAAGFDRADKIYALYYDGVAPSGGCGVADALESMAVLFLKDLPGDSECSSFGFAESTTAAPAFSERVMFHEILHAAGFVDPTAPNARGGNHVWDSRADVMAVGPGQTFPMVLDANGDDYYGPAVPAGVLNLNVSPFLKP